MNIMLAVFTPHFHNVIFFRLQTANLYHMKQNTITDTFDSVPNTTGKKQIIAKLANPVFGVFALTYSGTA